MICAAPTMNDFTPEERGALRDAARLVLAGDADMVDHCALASALGRLCRRDGASDGTPVVPPHELFALRAVEAALEDERTALEIAAISLGDRLATIRRTA